jgi:hypothetical protein
MVKIVEGSGLQVSIIGLCAIERVIQQKDVLDWKATNHLLTLLLSFYDKPIILSLVTRIITQVVHNVEKGFIRNLTKFLNV